MNDPSEPPSNETEISTTISEDQRTTSTASEVSNDEALSITADAPTAECMPPTNADNRASSIACTTVGEPPVLDPLSIASAPLSSAQENPESLLDLHPTIVSEELELQQSCVDESGSELPETSASANTIDKESKAPQLQIDKKPQEDDSIFAEPTEYGEEFLLTENMVNSYTFSEESASTDGSNSPDEPNVKSKEAEIKLEGQDKTHTHSKQNEETTISKPNTNEESKAEEITNSVGQENENSYKLETSAGTVSDLKHNEEINKNFENIIDEIEADVKVTEPEKEELMNDSVTEDFSLNVSDDFEMENNDCSNKTKDQSETQNEETVEPDSNILKVEENCTVEKKSLDTIENASKIFKIERQSDIISGKMDMNSSTPDIQGVENSRLESVQNVDQESEMETSNIELKKEHISENVQDSNKEMEPQPGPSSAQDSQQSSSIEHHSVSTHTSDADDMIDMTDSLGLLSECRTLLRDDEDDEEDDDEGDKDDDNDDNDDESNQMGPDSSEVESILTTNDPSDTELADQPDKDTTVDAEDDQSDDAQVQQDAEKSHNNDMETEQGAISLKIATIVSALAESLEAEDVEKTKKDADVPMQTDAISEEKLESENTEPVTKVASPSTPGKTKKLEISKPGNVMNIVELEESSSSSESEVQEKKSKQKPQSKDTDDVEVTEESGDVEETISVKIPKEIDIMSTSGGDTSTIISTEAKNVISGVPTASPAKKSTPRINTSEITIKTQKMDPTITIADETEEPKTTEANEIKLEEKKKHNFSLEVFSVDSDEEDKKIDKAVKKESTLFKALTKAELSNKISAIDLQKARGKTQCVNYLCSSDPLGDYVPAPSFVLSYYEVRRSKRSPQLVCTSCLDKICVRTGNIMTGLDENKPLLSLDMQKDCQQLVEISDSDSESDGEDAVHEKEKLSEDDIRYLTDNLADVLNSTWARCDMDGQLRQCEEELKKQLDEVQKGCDEVDRLLAEEQKTMDQIRNELYTTFASDVKSLEPIEIIDVTEHLTMLTPPATPQVDSDTSSDNESRRSKRPRRNVDYNDARQTDSPVITDVKLGPKPGDENADVSVVKLSAEAAPPDLPPAGELKRPPLYLGDIVYAVRQAYVGSWALAKILELWKPGNGAGLDPQHTTARIRFVSALKGPAMRQLTGVGLAYSQPANVRLAIGTRVIALFTQTKGHLAKRETFYSGIVAEMPTPVNRFRYLVFFDDGYAQYVHHAGMRVVFETSLRVWEDVHENSREFVKNYLASYPERPMVRLQVGQALKTEYNGKWWLSRVICVDASLVQVQFESDGRLEWIYRGSTRLAPLFLALQAAERQRGRGMTRLNRSAAARGNIPYVEYTRTEEQDMKSMESISIQDDKARSQQQRAVAKKSTGPLPPNQLQKPGAPKPLDDLMTRVVYYSPKAAVRPHKMVAHMCGPQCRRTDVLPLKELKTYNPLTRPLLTGWERQVLRFKGKKVVMYRAPCGRRLRDIRELHRYLCTVESDCSVDLFDFNPSTHCLAEFVLNKCYVHKKDLSHGKENVPIPCVNYYDDSLPEFCLYNTERTPTKGVPLNLDPDFLCGCDCTDDCQDKSKCACWKMTLEGAGTIGLEGDDIGYQYKRLLEPLPSGIYECNSRCHCKHTCLNRVAQHPLQLKLQVFKTYNRGWGIRALNDVPKGAFLCVYAGNLLTDATANLDGINEGDEYLAELDYIEVVERMKEDYESDVPELRDKKSDDSDDQSDSEEEDIEDRQRRKAGIDADFKPEYIGPNTRFTKSLRRRHKDKAMNKMKEEVREAPEPPKEPKEGEEDAITISDDEEVREPSRFTAQTGLDDEDYTPRHCSVRSLYGADEKCYIMDAKVQGNIGRYLNHSCMPNVFVQNVFVDTHDPRFPWVAFFALSHIQAGSELTWNYNYDIGSVPDKVMYCKCGAANCRGRLL